MLLGLALRMLVFVTYQPAGLFSSDSYKYLIDADRLRPGPAHPFGYPALLVLLLPFKNLAVVSAVQHGLGLGIAVALYALLRRLGTGELAATIGALPWLLDALVLNMEQYVMAETLFVALVVAALAVLCWPQRILVRVAVLAGLLLALATMTRTVGLILVVPAAIYLLGRRAGRRQTAALVAAFALPLLVYATAYRAQFGTFGLTNIDGLVLYGRVAPFANCEGRLCDPRPRSERPGPNYYVSVPASPINRLRASAAERNRAGRKFFFRIVRHQPGDYLRQVGSDLVRYAKPTRAKRRRDWPYSTWRFHDTYSEPDLRAAAVRKYGGTLRIAKGPARFLEGYSRFVITPGILLALALLLGLAGSILGLRRRAESLLLSAAGFLLLLVPAATAVFDYRFAVPALALLPPAGALGASLLADRLPELRGH
ncbi:MAG: hypothetical protein M3R70_09920 [Actinomycetota bacterium]|nr:hypothetical protein [Actinomycetota bacterium]